MLVYRVLMLLWALWLAFLAVAVVEVGLVGVLEGRLWRSVALGSGWRGKAKKATARDAPIEAPVDAPGNAPGNAPGGPARPAPAPDATT